MHHADAGYWPVVIGVAVAVAFAVACALNLDNKLQPATSLWQLRVPMVKVKSQSASANEQQRGCQ